MRSGTGSIRERGRGLGESADAHRYVGKHTFVHVLDADCPVLQSSSSEPSLGSSADSSQSLEAFRQRRVAAEWPEGGGVGGSGSSRDRGPGGSGGAAGSSDGHALVVKHTFVHVVDDEKRIAWSSSSEPSLSLESASSSEHHKKSYAALAAVGGSASSDIAGKGGRGRGRSRGAGSSGDGGGKGGIPGGVAPSSSHGRGRGRSRGQQDSGGSADAAGFHKADAPGSEGPGHAEGTCVPCVFVTRGEACPNRPTCNGCHHAQHLAKYRSRRPCKNKREKYMKALQEGLDQVEQNPNLEIDEVILPASVKDNSIYQAKFLERMRLHKDWLASGGSLQSGESPAAVVRGPRVATEAVPTGEAPPVRIIMSL